MSDAAKTLQKAVGEHNAGRFGEAEKLYKRVLNSDPNNADALRLLGLLASQVGRHDIAERLQRQALLVRPLWPEAWADLGVALAGLSRFPEAKAAYEKALALRPNFAGAKSNLAELTKRMGRLDEAIALWNEAIQLDPALPEPYYNMGGVFFSQGKTAEAEEYFKKSLERRPTYAPAYNNLGAVRWSTGRRKEAADDFTKAVQLNPQYAEAWNNLGQVRWEQGKMTEAMQCYKRSVALQPGAADTHNNLGVAYERLGDRAAAVKEWEEALKLRPGWETPQYYLAAARAAPPPKGAPPSYVATLFDDYADKFDEHLTTTLEYRVPQFLLEAVGRLGVNHFEQVLDLGCGTGLCGEKFRPLTARLVGLDLSPRMLEKAREKGIYDELIKGELVEELNKRQPDADLLIAGDVLIYLGELRDVFLAASRAMRQGARFAFTVEKLAAGEYELRESRRFAHSLAYLQEIVRAAGLDIEQVSEEILRLDGKQPIEGMVLVLRKK